MSSLDNTLKLIEFKTTDNIFLPGLLYEPRSKTKKAAIFLHGNGSSSVFYSVERMNSTAEVLNKEGIAYFPFNNRGANYIKKLSAIRRGKEKRVKLGMAHELIKDCIKDIDGAIAYLAKLGYREFYLVGISTGANKICVYNYYKPKNKISKYILLSPGDDTGIYYHDLGKKKYFQVLEKCRRAIRQGRGDELVPSSFSPNIISYASLYDTINPDGNYNVFPFFEYTHKLKLSKKKLFRMYRSIKKPTLAVLGEFDEYFFDGVNNVESILKKECGAPEQFDIKIIKNTDHGFNNKPKHLAETIAKWLKG